MRWCVAQAHSELSGELVYPSHESHALVFTAAKDQMVPDVLMIYQRPQC